MSDSNDETPALLRGLGVAYAQGYHIAEPAPVPGSAPVPTSSGRQALSAGSWCWSIRRSESVSADATTQPASRTWSSSS